MNTIAALTRSDPARAEEAVTDLADLFRANLREQRSSITLKEELEVARIYQRIEQLRLGERLRVIWDVTELPMRAQVPGLLMQPLLENAIYHGIEPRPEGGIVTVSGALDDGIITLKVRNPLPAAGERRAFRQSHRARQYPRAPGNSSIRAAPRSRRSASATSTSCNCASPTSRMRRGARRCDAARAGRR